MGAYGMDPEPGAVASALGARGQIGDLELGVEIPDAGLVDGEDSEVVGLQGVHVGLVSDGQRTALHVVFASGMESRGLSPWAGPVAAVADITTNSGHLRCVYTECAMETHP